MEVTLLNHGGIINIHKAGCKDLTKGINKYLLREADTFPTMEAAMDCYLDKGDPNEPGWDIGDMKFHNCTKK